MDIEYFLKKIDMIEKGCQKIKSILDDSTFEGQPDYARSLMVMYIPDYLLRMKRIIGILHKKIKFK